VAVRAVAREFYRDLLALRAPNVPALLKVDQLRGEKGARVQAIRGGYDDATDHGKDAEEQRHWRVRVAQWESHHQIVV
jgi:hypothetical protein